MLGNLLTLLATALSLLVVDLVFPRGVDIANLPAALIAAVAIGFVNAFIKPVLSILSLPLNFLTFGLFSLVINGISFWLASLFVPGFSVHGLVPMIASPIILSAVSTFLNNYFVERQPAISSADANPALKTEV